MDGKPCDDKTDAALQSKEDDDMVDLFIDLGIADTAGGWSIYGSSDSLPSDTMMPPYFDPTQMDKEEEPDGVALKDIV